LLLGPEVAEVLVLPQGGPGDERERCECVSESSECMVGLW
jgi:hypothetical protein